MKEKQLVDVLKPYEGELLFSWVVRMGNHCGIFNWTEAERRRFKKVLFGETASGHPKIYFEPCLSVLADRINLPNSEYFESAESILRKMTVFPFYEAFLTEKKKKKTLERLLRKSTEKIVALDRMPGLEVSGIMAKNPYYELKYCPECIREYGVYLLSEHQVPRNDVCARHRLILQTFPYERNWGKLNFVKNIPLCLNEKVRKIEKVQEEDIRYQVSVMVHEVFQKGFRDSLSVLKAKLRKKLQILGYLSEENHFIDFWTFYDEVGAGEYFQSMEQAANVMISGLFVRKAQTSIDPIIYLFLIARLFGSLEDYYLFCVTEKDIEKNCYRKRSHQEKLFLEIRNKKRYLTAREYSTKYSKTNESVQWYCREGRLDGSVKLGKTWFIPEDASYPKNGRCKDVSTDHEKKH